jgi:hypothetical protein
MKTIQQYLDYWNNFIDEWYLDPLNSFQSEKNYWSKFENLSRNADALPEPYYGNPWSFSTIVLNLNPYGGVNYQLQKHPDGLFFNDFKPGGLYSDFAQAFPYLNKYKETNIGKWWTIREQWINRLSASTRKPFSIQICPWHSKFSDGLGSKKYSIGYINDYIIKPAEIILKKADLKIILSVGKEFEYLYKDLGFNYLEQFSSDPVLKNRNYPLGKNNMPIKRFYNVWESSTGIIFLNTFTVGTNECPRPEFNQVEFDILSMLRRSGKSII